MQDTLQRNAEYVERQFGISRDDYQKLCDMFHRSKKHSQLIEFDASAVTKMDTAFAIGLITGYLMVNNPNQIKQILD